MPKQITKECFILRAQQVHGTRYDYSNVVYTGMRNKVKIIDPDYGEFWQSPFGHLQGQGHPSHGKVKVGNKRRMPFDEFIQRAKEVHGDLYDYSKVKYTHCDSKVCIVDPEYGEFWQSPYQHLRSHGCPQRTKERKWYIHEDHIIPLSIVRSSKRKENMWCKDRPLYLFLNSPINRKKISATANNKKSDLVTVNGKVISASSVRNNYEVIALLIRNVLRVDPSEVINSDRLFVQEYLGIA